MQKAGKGFNPPLPATCYGHDVMNVIQGLAHADPASRPRASSVAKPSFIAPPSQTPIPDARLTYKILFA